MSNWQGIKTGDIVYIPSLQDWMEVTAITDSGFDAKPYTGMKFDLLKLTEEQMAILKVGAQTRKEFEGRIT